jgi:hypothetical protein
MLENIMNLRNEISPEDWDSLKNKVDKLKLDKLNFGLENKVKIDNKFENVP